MILLIAQNIRNKINGNYIFCILNREMNVLITIMCGFFPVSDVIFWSSVKMF